MLPVICNVKFTWSRVQTAGTSREWALLSTADHPCQGLSYVWSVHTGWYACIELASPLPTDRREREGKTGESRSDKPVILVVYISWWMIRSHFNYNFKIHSMVNPAPQMLKYSFSCHVRRGNVLENAGTVILHPTSFVFYVLINLQMPTKIHIVRMCFTGKIRWSRRKCLGGGGRVDTSGFVKYLISNMVPVFLL